MTKAVHCQRNPAVEKIAMTTKIDFGSNCFDVGTGRDGMGGTPGGTGRDGTGRDGR